MQTNSSNFPLAAKCTAHNRDGSPCKSFPVEGWTVCRMHGAGGGRPVTRPDTIIKKALQMNDLRVKGDNLVASGKDVLDLVPIAAMLHVLADEISLDRDSVEGGVDGEKLQLLLSCLDLLRKTAGTVESIRASKAFTNAERDWFVLALSGFVELLPEAERPKFKAYITEKLQLRSSAAKPLG